ncbi:MAG: choice-of-anchor D domain-containing protein [Bacteroidetes bacterium]|nr:choice-of-anchor D domain-containing protein [Bacteroidota bacterium]MBU1720802.1 choice-of-anchor D domain-containing protein [Bacteroidota bacterium]
METDLADMYGFFHRGKNRISKTYRGLFFVSAVLTLLLCTLSGRGQIAAWDFFGESVQVTSAADVFHANLVSGSGANDMTRGSGAAASAGSNSFRTVGFKNNGISTSNTDYFQITITASTGYKVSLSTINAKFAGTATFCASPGVSTQFAYSLDGSNFTLIGSSQSLIGTPATLTQIDLSGISQLQNVAAGTTITMRYYASGQTTTGGWGFYSASAGQYGLAIGGSVSAVPSGWVSAANGNWNTPATWTPASVPTAGGPVTINHAVTTTGYVSNTGTVTVNPGGSLAIGAEYANSGTTNIDGTLQLNSGSWISTNAPVYGSSSTLVYNVSYGVYNEWTGNSTTAGAGVPNNVTIQSGAVVTMPTSDRGLAGNLNISDGELKLNGTSGDLYIAGNWTRASGELFTPQNRAVFFNGSGTQTVSVTGGGTETFNYLLVNGSGTLKLSSSPATNVTVNASSGLSLSSTHPSSTIDLNGQTFTVSGGGNLNLNSGARYLTSTVANGVFKVTSSKITLTNGGTLTSDANSIVSLWSGLDCGSGADHYLTVNGTFLIDAGGWVEGHSPKYGSSSLLKYNTGGTYERQLEWTKGSGTIAVTEGFPNHVQISNNSTLDYVNISNTGDKAIYGNLTIDAGSSLYMDYGSVSCVGPMIVGGNVSVTGNFSLGYASGDDLKLSGNLTFNPGYSFNSNNRAVFFTKDGTQTASAPATLTLPYIVIGKGGGSGTTVQLSGIDMIASAPNTGNAISFTNSTDIFDINGRTLTIGTAATANTITGSGTFKGSTSSNLTLVGTGSVGTLSFTPGFQNLGTFTINRTSSGNVNLGSAVTVNTSLALTSGLLTLGSSHLTLASGAGVSGSPTVNNMVVADGTGEFRKTFSVAGSFTYPIGDDDAPDGAQYSPVTLAFTGGSYGGYAGLRVVDLKHPNNQAPTDYITRYWAVSSSGISPTSYNFSGTYTAADIAGTESNSTTGQWNGTLWALGSAAGSNTCSFTGVTTLPATNHFTAGTPLAPKEINIKGNGVSIVDGDASPSVTDDTDFGTVLVVSGTSEKTYTIENLGTENLTLSGTPKVVVSGAHASDFTVTLQPSSPITCSGTTTFTVQFDPSAGGVRTATLTIASDDADEGTYDFAIQGNGSTACAMDLIISEYIEGGSSEKYIEIYNGTGSNVDLSNYKLQLYSNGASSPTNDVTLSGTLNDGSVIVYMNSAATLYSGTSNSAVNFNGDDAVALYKISPASFVDIIGEIGDDPGTAWVSGSHSTLDKTLVRKSTVYAGVSTNPTGFPTLESEWDLYNINDVSHLGSHTMSCAVNPEPTNYPTDFTCGITTYSEIPLTWTAAAAGTQAPDYYLIKWSDVSYGDISDPVDGTEESDGAGVKNITYGTNNYTPSGLDENTTYYFKIWSYTNTGSDVDYKTGSEPQTSCTTQPGPCLAESFETFPPAGWSNGGTVSKTSGGCEGVKALTFNGVNDYIITPPIDNPTELIFQYKRSSDATAWTLKVQYCTTLGGTYTDIGSVSNATTSCQEKVIDLSSLPENTYYLKFLDARSSGTNERYIDDVIVNCLSTCSPPTVDATGFSASSVTNSSMTLSWSSGNGSRRIVVARAGGAVSFSPSDNTTYPANSDYSEGTDLGSGNIVVYNGTGATVDLTGLEGATTYYFKVFEYNCSDGHQVYFTTGTPLTGSQTTLVSPVTDLEITCETNSTMVITWVVPDGNFDGVIIGVRNSTNPCHSISDDASNYTANSVFGSGTSYGGTTPYSFAVYKGTGTTVTVTGLTTGQPYQVKAYAYKNATGSLWASSQPTSSTASLELSDVASVATTPDDGEIQLTWIEPPVACYDEIMIVAKAGGTVSASPSGDGSAYSADLAFGSGTAFDGGYVVYKGTNTPQTVTGLTNGTEYCFTFFTRKGTDWSDGISDCETPSAGVTQFVSGDIAVLAVCSDIEPCVGGSNGDDEISFICFKDINPGTSFDITDNGWEKCNAGQWGNAEGYKRIKRKSTASTVTAGTVITFRLTASSPFFTVVSPDNDWDIEIEYGPFILNKDGDQIYFMHGGTWDDGTPGDNNATYIGGEILFGFNTNDTWTAGICTAANNTAGEGRSQNSGLYPYAECFNMMPGVATDYIKYIGDETSASQVEWIARIKDSDNWSDYPDCAGFYAGDPKYHLGRSEPIDGVGLGFIEGKWTGAGGNSDWFDCSNWDNMQVPDEDVDVSLPYNGGTDLVEFDYFTDNNYTADPTWTVQAGGFIATGARLEGTDANLSDVISTPCTQAYGSWEFTYAFEVATTSAYVRYFIIMSADNANPSAGTADGYYVWVDGGGTTQDLIFRRLDNGAPTNLIVYDWIPGTATHTIKVTRSLSNEFELFYDGASVGTYTDNTYTTSSYMGVWTTGNLAIDNHRIDNIKTSSAGPANDCVIGAPPTGFTEASCKSLTNSLPPSLGFYINNAASLLHVYGDFTNNASFSHTNGTVHFLGSAGQTIGGTSATSFYNLTMNNTSTGVTISRDITVSNNLALTDGVISTGSYRLTMSSSSSTSLTGGSSASFVYGNLRRYITSNTNTYAFPVGDGTATTNYKRADFVNANLAGLTYLDISVASTSESGDNIDDNLDLTEDGTELTDLMQAAVWTIVPQGGWSFASGSYGVKLYVANTGLSAADDNTFVAVKRDDLSTDYEDWDNFEGTTTIPAASAAGRIYNSGNGYAQRLGYTSFSKHAIVRGDAMLPIELLSLDAVLNEGYATVNWITASEINNDYFVVEKSIDGNNFSGIGRVQGAGNSNTKRLYSFPDPELITQTSYYRLQQYDYDGSFSYSDIVLVSPDMQEQFSVSNVNSENGDVTFTLNNPADLPISIRITDMTGRIVYLSDYQAVSSGIYKIAASSLSKGIYCLSIFSEQNLFSTKFFID